MSRTSASKSTGARGPTGPSGQARSSPAGNKGGGPGSVSRTGSSAPKGGYRGPVGGGGQPRTSPAGNKGGGAGAVSRSNAKTGPRGPLGPQGQAKKPSQVRPMSSFERFQARFPSRAGMPVASIPSPVPGAVGPVGAAASRLAKYASGVFGARRAAQTQKKLEDLKRLEKEIASMRGPSSAKKISVKNAPRTLAELRAARTPVRGEKIFGKIDDAIDSVTSAMGFGVGPVARAKAAAVSAGAGEASRTAAEKAFGIEGYRRGGVVKKSKPRKK